MSSNVDSVEKPIRFAAPNHPLTKPFTGTYQDRELHGTQTYAKSDIGGQAQTKFRSP